MKQYLDLLQDIRENGVQKGDRTGTGTLSVFGRQMRFDLSEGLPLVTTKRIHLKSVIHELLWFLRGDTDIRYLQDNGVTIWDEWADVNAEVGPSYGKQWTAWDAGNGSYINQITDTIEMIKNNPDSRRLLVTAWNPADVEKVRLPWCHVMFQFYVADGKLSCQVYQRSCDTFLGVPYNITSYALLTHMFAQQCGLEVGDLVWVGGDTHLYLNHLEQAELQLSRTPRGLSKLVLNKADSIFDYKYEDFEIREYNYWPAIKADVSV